MRHARATRPPRGWRPWRALPRLLLAALLLVLAAGAWALDPGKPYRDYVVETWGVEKGLPQITVMAIAQDADGYLWVGTQAGLARFDGVQFRRFEREDVLNMDSMIQALLADPQGRLWIGTAKGLLVLEHGRIRPLSAPAGIAHFPVAALALSEGRLVVAGPDGLYVPDGQRLRRLRALPGPATSLLAEGAVLWAGGPGQVLRIEGDRVQAFPLPASLPGASVSHLARFDGDLWAGTRSGLLRLHAGHWEVVAGRDGGQVRAIEALAADRSGNLWLATPQYLERLRPGQAPERIENQPGSIAVRALFEDQDGNLWLGSQTEGLARVWSGRARRLSSAEGLATPLLWSLSAAPDGGVVVGTGNGVEEWRQGRFHRLVTGAGLPHPEAYSVLAEAGQVWIGTRAGAAVLRAGQAHAEIPPALAPLRGMQVHALLRDHAGNLWFGTTGGAFRLTPDGRLTRYAEAEGLVDPRVRIVHETRDGRLLLGTAQGLYEWRDGRLRILAGQDGTGGDVGVTTLNELGDGRLVVGSASGDHLRLFDGRRWQSLGTGSGLPENIPFHIAQVGNDLWVAGMQGVYRLGLAELDHALADPQARVQARLIINSGFNLPGGQQDKCCNGMGSGRGLLRDGQLWLPTRDGALVVSTARLPPGPQWTPRIEDVLVDGKPLLAEGGRLRLPLGARSLKIEFSVPALHPTRLPQLRYRLVGYDADWVETESPAQRQASYANLPPGDYRFELADFARDDPLAAQAALELQLPPRLYETLAFRILLGLALVVLVWLGYLALRLRYGRRQAELERLVRERTHDLQIANARLKELSFTDPLTGLHNRRYLSQQVPIDLSFYDRDPAFRTGEEAVVLALLDIDHFKHINDTWGHAAGDLVLEQLGRVLDGLKRSGDYAARWGGEEFLLVLRPLPRGGLAQIGRRVCQQIGSHVFDLGNGQQHRLTVSVGLVECPLFPQHPRLLGWDQLVTLADRALYAAKDAGRNGWMAYRPAPGTHLPADLSSASGDPGWLVENGLLERFGEAGPDPYRAGGHSRQDPAPDAPPPLPQTH